MGIGNRRTGGFLLCVLLLLSLAGCGERKTSLREEAPPPAATGPRVAVAPMENWSNDLSASEIIRSAFVGEITRQGWNVVPTEESDQALRETLGVSYGGQLASTTPEEVCRALKVEGVFYGEVREWNKTTTGVYNNVTVIASFELYGKDGTRVWEESDTKSKVIVPQGRGGAIGAEIVIQALGNLLLHPMTPYGKAVAKNIAGKLPGGLLEGREGTMEIDNTVRGTGTPEERGGTR
ncbi:MAG: hypothetical protein WBG20_04595 [Candidatus Deferrimicrobiaceae bacterium]